MNDEDFHREQLALLAAFAKTLKNTSELPGGETLANLAAQFDELIQRPADVMDEAPPLVSRLLTTARSWPSISREIFCGTSARNACTLCPMKKSIESQRWISSAVTRWKMPSPLIGPAREPMPGTAIAPIGRI